VVTVSWHQPVSRPDLRADQRDLLRLES
jgi:hypothetical protein